MDELLFKPVIDFEAGTQEFELGAASVEVTVDGSVYPGKGRALLRFKPRPSLLIEAQVSGMRSGKVLATRFGLSEFSAFRFAGREIEGFGSIGGKLNADEKTVFWHPRSEPIIGVGDDNTEFDYAIFHLFNFRDFMSPKGKSERRGNTVYAIYEVDLCHENFRVTLKSLAETSANQKRIQDFGECLITHVGAIQHLDGSPINGKVAADQLMKLMDFLSFVNGKRTNPAFCCGFNSAQKRVWESWSSPFAFFNFTNSWFDDQHCEQMSTFFAGYFAKIQDEIWRKALHEAIYWYLIANDSSRGIDAGIILAQAALELLAFTFAVNHSALISVEGFKTIWASDKLRLLLSSIGIPLKIPDQCTALHDLNSKRSKQKKWRDLPHAVTEVRNSLVHPDKSDRDEFMPVYNDTWTASLWLLELCVLRLCGYEGTYGNRLSQRIVGQVERVPWAS